MNLETIIAVDRDGTFIEDSDRNFPGKNWPDTTDIKLIQDSLEGLRELRQIPKAKMVVVSNQAGPARGKIPLENIPLINNYIHSLLKNEGIEFDNWYFCPHVTPEYAEEKRKEGKTVDSQYVTYCRDRKPFTGMIEDAAWDFFRLPMTKCNVYVIGDRAIDVETGINAGGKGILIPVEKGNYHPEEISKVFKLYDAYTNRKVHIASSMKKAAEWIKKDLNI